MPCSCIDRYVSMAKQLSSGQDGRSFPGACFECHRPERRSRCLPACGTWKARLISATSCCLLSADGAADGVREAAGASVGARRGRRAGRPVRRPGHPHRHGADARTTLLLLLTTGSTSTTHSQPLSPTRGAEGLPVCLPSCPVLLVVCPWQPGAAAGSSSSSSDDRFMSELLLDLQMSLSTKFNKSVPPPSPPPMRLTSPLLPRFLPLNPTRASPHSSPSPLPHSPLCLCGPPSSPSPGSCRSRTCGCSTSAPSPSGPACWRPSPSSPPSSTGCTR